MQMGGEVVAMIYHLETLEREIPTEDPEQVLTIATMLYQHDIPVLKRMLRELEAYRSGKKVS